MAFVWSGEDASSIFQPRVSLALLSHEGLSCFILLLCFCILFLILRSLMMNSVCTIYRCLFRWKRPPIEEKPMEEKPREAEHRTEEVDEIRDYDLNSIDFPPRYKPAKSPHFLDLPTEIFDEIFKKLETVDSESFRAFCPMGIFVPRNAFFLAFPARDRPSHV